MAKRLMALLGMLVLLLTTALPAAFAQETPQYGGGEISATGVIIGELPADVATNGTHSINDEASGTYALRSDAVDLDAYVGQRVTVYGALTPGEGPAPGEEFGGSLPSIDVTRVEPAGSEAGPVKLTGMIESEPASGGPPVFSITDEATGERYVLDAGEGADYSLYEGRRVSVEGIPRTDPNTGFNFLQVAVIRPLDGPLGNDTITATFKLAVECEPPAGTTFFAGASQQTAGLTDPDGDGLYTGSLTLPEGFYDLGAFPVPVDILAGTPEVPNQQTIKSFGEMVLEDGDAFSASVSYCDGGTEPVDPAPVDPVDPAPVVEPAPGVDGGGNAVVSGGGNNAGKGGASSGVDVDGNGSMDASDGEKAAEISASAPEGSASSAARVLPATGGVLPIAGLAGLLIVAAGLSVRRISR